MSEDLDATWSDHSWFLERRHFELESGQSIIQRNCVRCGRDFVIDRSSGARYAVHSSIFSFNRLSEEVQRRWLSETCPGKYMASDNDDRGKRIGELPISWERTRDLRAASHLRAK